METDNQLVKQVLNGDLDSFDRLVEKYQRKIFGVAYHWTRNLADAQDITQDTFIQAYEKLGQLRDPEKLASWLHKIAINACREWQRSLPEQILSIDAPENQRLRDDLPSSSNLPEENLEAKEKHQAIKEILNRLSDKVRLTTTLFYIDDLSYQEISNFLGVSIPTVKSRLYKARMQLRKETSQMENNTLGQQNKKLKIENLHLFDNEFFQEAVRRNVSEYYAHFSTRLTAIYVWGSVHRNEAVPGVSDLQLHPFISDSFGEDDKQWCKEMQRRLDKKECPEPLDISPPRSVEYVLQGMQPDADKNSRLRSRAFGFRLRYDATLVWGSDLIDALEVPPPNKPWAHGMFHSPWELTRYAAELVKENRTDFSLPHAPPLRLRKLARLGVLGGACLLMAKEQFRSFKGTDVIPALEKTSPNWADFLDKTRGLYIHLSEATDDEVSGYLSQLVSWMDWIGTQLE